MANPYCSQNDLFAMYDQRVMLNLSGDKNASQGDLGNVQTLLDIQAGDLEAVLSGRYPLPLPTVPLVLKKWVGITTAGRLYARRNDMPKGLAADLEWAKDWLKQLTDGVIGLPGIDRATAPNLENSTSLHGRSRFDFVFGQHRTKSEPGGNCL